MYPVMLDMRHKKVLIVGGGAVALRKVRGLQDEQAEIALIAPEIVPELYEYDIRIIQEHYHNQDISIYDFIFITTDDKDTNARIVSKVQRHQWLNDCTNQKNSNFFNVASIDEGDYKIMISTEGKSPATSKQLKHMIESFIETRRYH